MIQIADLLDQEALLACRDVLARAPFKDGVQTAGAAASKVKRNQQARGDDPEVLALGRRVRLALERNDVVRRLVRPVRWSSLIFSRYVEGDEYGLHADNAIMSDSDGWQFRTDVSFTLFLSDPATYDGGALLISDTSGEREYRPEAGRIIFYPTGYLHRVTPVTAGERLACVGWVQSFIRRPDQREVLFDLECLRDTATAATALTLDKTIGNLLRMWGEV